MTTATFGIDARERANVYDGYQAGACAICGRLMKECIPMIQSGETVRVGRIAVSSSGLRYFCPRCMAEDDRRGALPKELTAAQEARDEASRWRHAARRMAEVLVGADVPAELDEPDEFLQWAMGQAAARPAAAPTHFDHYDEVSWSDAQLFREMCEGDEALAARVVTLARVLGTQRTILGIQNMSITRLAQTPEHSRHIRHVVDSLYELGETPRRALIRAALSAYGIEE